MKTMVLAVMGVVLAAGPAGAEDPAASLTRGELEAIERPGAEDPAENLTRGKLEADLGHHSTAAAAFTAVVEAPQASAEQRWEALIRLGAARRETGDLEGSADAFEEAWRTYGRDPEALRFLLQALGSALPGRERWEEVWSKVVVDFDRTGERPAVHVKWPGVEPSLCPCSGTPNVDFDFQDGDLQDVLRLIADVTGENVVVMPGIRGFVTIRVEQMPWDAALEAMLAPSGYIALHEGNVILVCRADDAPAKRTFTGEPIEFLYQGADLVQVLREIAGHGGAQVEIPEGVIGQVTFRLVEVPWDQAFDLVAHTNGLTWTRVGDVIRVEPRRRPPSD